MKIHLNLLLKLTMFTLFVGLSGAVANSLYQINRIKAESQTEDQLIHASKAALNARFHIVQIQQFLTDASLMKELDGAKEAKENLESAHKELDKITAIFPDKKAMIDTLKESATTLDKTGEEMLHAYLEKGAEAGNEIMKRPKTGLDAASEEATNQIDQIVKDFDSQLDNSVNNLSNVEHQANLWIIALSVALLALISFALLFVFKRVNPISALASKLNQQAMQLQEASEKLVNVSESLTDTTSKEASALHQSATALAEITSMVKKTEESAVHLSEVSDVSSEKANQGQKAFELLVTEITSLKDVIQSIMNEVNHGNKEISGIMNLVADIEQKTRVINDIVFQTKLLSFNASVEAARAGEHGKGFSVVAEEIGNLAVMSGNASKDISTLLDSSLARIKDIIQTTSHKMSSLMGLSEKSLSSSFEKLNDGSRSVQTIVSNVSELRSLISEMTGAIQEQTKGVEEVNEAINLLQTSSLEVTTSAEKGNSVAQALKTDSEHIRTISHDLEKIVTGVDNQSTQTSADLSHHQADHEDLDIAS